ncbi:protein phosphatase 1 regulatory subunit 14C-like isoform X2 [Portunus trituberculatus]|uniref:protein phosphatase 1 regulatory subunit 14C-like isoform X2 n=1 Tax=Portunus trituberculatus TaxID=210409 RepID=UPI001E1D1E9F|nr:protein phosphatase 1 regulatory subunit 14C-like isoform X2 [Portunus trituberculatus]
MASKLRRPPLFGLDNPLGIPVLPKYSSAACKCSPAPTNTTPTSAPKAALPTKKATPPPVPPRPHKSGMEVGVASYTSGRPMSGSPDRGRGGPPRSNLHVEFAQIGEVKERKEKYLTAKYGAHQMSLIRKRLNVEMWMFDQLQSLYPAPQDGKYEEKELDLDELLDVDGELKKRKYLWDSLADCKQSKDKVEKFINELLERATTL